MSWERESIESIESAESQSHELQHHPQALEGKHGTKERRRAESITTSGSQDSKALKRVPVRKRRGLAASICVIPEYEDARDYPNSIKRCIVFIIAFASVCGPLGTSIMLPAIDDIERDLNTTVSIVNVSVGIYLLSLGIFPLWWSRFSEKQGRRTVYIVSFVMFCAFAIGCALSPSIAALIILRVLCGGCSASVQAVGAGTIGDLYIPEERGSAMGLYYLGPLMGPFLAPIIGGVVAEVWGWRATQWTLVIFSGVAACSIIFFLPETLRKQDNLAAILQALLKNAEGEDDEDDDEEDDEDDEDQIGIDADMKERQGKDEEREPETVKQDKSAPSHETPRNSDLLQRQKSHSSTVGSERSKKSMEKELKRVLSSQEYNDPALLDALRRTVSANSRRRDSDYVEAQHDEEASMAFDPLTPSLSRMHTNTMYSKQVAEQLEVEDLEKILTKARELQESLKDEKKSFGRRLLSQADEYLIRPMRSLILLLHPPVALVIAYCSITFAIIYFFNMSISYEYARRPYKFKPIIVGLLYIPNSVTYVIASVCGGRWNDKLLVSYAKKHNGQLVPEARISWNVVVAICTLPPACLIFGWCLNYGEHWTTPLIGSALLGFGSMIVTGATVTYLVDTLPGKGATGVALNNLIRQILASVATFVVEPLLRAIGPGILFSILAGIIAFSSIFLIILKRNGTYYRKNSNLVHLYEFL